MHDVGEWEKRGTEVFLEQSTTQYSRKQFGKQCTDYVSIEFPVQRETEFEIYYTNIRERFSSMDR